MRTRFCQKTTGSEISGQAKRDHQTFPRYTLTIEITKSFTWGLELGLKDSARKPLGPTEEFLCRLVLNPRTVPYS